MITRLPPIEQKIYNLPVEKQVKALGDYLMRYRRESEFLLNGNLDEGNVVRAGSVYAENIDTLHAKIGVAQIEDLVVGGNVAMGPNATISWSKVTNQPSIPVLPSYIKSTYIDSATVQSPTIIGGSVTGGVITAGDTYKLRLSSGNDFGALNFLTPSSGWLGALHCNSGVITLESSIGVDIQLLAYGTLLLSSYSGTEFLGDVDFSSANVSGLSYAPTSHTHSYLRNSSGQDIKFQVYNGHLEFSVDGGAFVKIANFSDIP